ncbi:MAG: hypothetical protein M0016_00060 [Deltaproteobacteria bacterium]|jgi:hypothetical protein|nr:hypothetical protein [Deltaproteobacteria bacterium]
MLQEDDFRFILIVMKAESYHEAFSEMNDNQAQELNRLIEESESAYEEGFQELKSDFEARYDVDELEKNIEAGIFNY